jgi:predicted secreted protein
MQKKRVITLIGITLALIVTMNAGAGDIANFVNLGFSDDSKTFMFGQFGVNAESSTPYAETYIIDVPANRFLSSGVTRESFDVAVGPGDNGRGALFTVLGKQTSLIERYRINHLKTGRLLYVLINGETPRTELSFRDFETTHRYTVTLHQSSRGEGDSIRARFHITLNRTTDAGTRSYTVGLPEYDRPGISQYQIHQIYLSPDEKSLVFVIEMQKPGSRSSQIRYMVETVQL